jgi:hypothetical protein
VSIPVRDFFMSKMAGLKRYALTPGIDFSNHGGNEAGEVSYTTSNIIALLQFMML